MEFSVKVEGLERIHRVSRQVQQSIDTELKRALLVSAKKVEGDAKRSIMEGGKTGRIYKRGGVVHRASAPGEAPANDTGRLVNNINSSLNTVKGNEATVWVNKASVAYAAMLEFGTHLMSARPFFFPALERNKEWIRERLNKAVRDGARKGTRGNA